MKWMFWRRRDIEQAMRAWDEARQNRDAVDSLADDLKERGARNNFAPLLLKAFRGDG